MVAHSADWGLPMGANPTRRDLAQVVKEKAAALKTRMEAEEAILLQEKDRLDLEVVLACRRRYLRNLQAIRDKAKSPAGHCWAVIL
jgi:hypothetical protein